MIMAYRGEGDAQPALAADVIALMDALGIEAPQAFAQRSSMSMASDR